MIRNNPPCRVLVERSVFNQAVASWTSGAGWGGREWAANLPELVTDNVVSRVTCELTRGQE